MEIEDKMEEKMLYMECYSGISGDMVVGALLDLGADEDVLRHTLDQLQLPGYEINISRIKKNGIDACGFDVSLPGNPCYDEGHGMTAETCISGAGHEHSHGHEDGDEHNGHKHGSEYSHGYEHGDKCSHVHHHRNLQDVCMIIDRINHQEIRNLAQKIFRIVAEAEAEVHAQPLEQVHFHEVGAIDSIVDIVSVAACICSLEIKGAVVSELYEGKGHVVCQHGKMPVPAPAVLKIAETQGLYLHLCNNDGEMVTPTGAAIAAALKTQNQLPFRYRVLKTGNGAGKKNFAAANILRIMMIEGK